MNCACLKKATLDELQILLEVNKGLDILNLDEVVKDIYDLNSSTKSDSK